MTKRIYILLSLLTFVTLTGCISYNRILSHPVELSPYSVDNINGNYSNLSIHPDAAGLWPFLYQRKTHKKDTTRATPTSTVNLHFNGQDKLVVTISENGKMLNKIELKARLIKGRVGIQNLYLIPIPSIYYRHDELKVMLSNDSSGNLNVTYGTEQIVWLLLIGGYEEIDNLRFPKVE